LNGISWFRAFYFATAGILFALFLYNVFLYSIVRDRVYSYYLGYVAFFGGFLFFYESGFLFEIPLFSRLIAGTNPLVFFPILHLGFAFTLLFTDTLLTLPPVAPRWSKVLRVLAVLQLVFMLVEWSFVGADRYRTFPIFYPLGKRLYVVWHNGWAGTVGRRNHAGSAAQLRKHDGLGFQRYSLALRGQRRNALDWQTSRRRTSLRSSHRDLHTLPPQPQ
jgi:hypothetical protein